MKKLLEIECCSECPHSNMATTASCAGYFTTSACMLDGEEKDLPDNVLFDRIIPEWCKLESKLSQPILTDEKIKKEAFLDGWDACADNSYPVDGASIQRIADYDKWKKGG